MSTSQEDIVAALGRIKVPVSILSREHDGVDPPYVLERELLPRLARAQMDVLPQVGHLLPYEASDDIADLVRAFALSLTDPGTSRPHCSWCGVSLAAIASARLGRTRPESGSKSAATDQTEKHKDLHHV